MSASCAESFPVYHYSLIYGDIRMGLQKEQPYSMNSAYSPWSMGCGFKSHQANKWRQEGHPTTIAPVLHA